MVMSITVARAFARADDVRRVQPERVELLRGAGRSGRHGPRSSTLNSSVTSIRSAKRVEVALEDRYVALQDPRAFERGVSAASALGPSLPPKDPGRVDAGGSASRHPGRGDGDGERA